MAAIVVTEQPVSVNTTYGEIVETMSVVATNAEGYQWFLNDAVVVGEVTDTFTIPTDLLGGTYEVYCILSADGEDDVVTDVVYVVVGSVLPEIPSYITGEFVLDYLNRCDTRVRERFERASALSSIVIEDTDDVLRTAQLELFKSVL